MRSLLKIFKNIRFIFSAPRYVIPIPVLNKIGFQALRIKLKTSKIFYIKKSCVSDKVSKAVEKLEKNGFLVVNDFLTNDELNELYGEIELLKKSSSLKFESNREGGKIEWEHGNFSTDKKYCLVDKKFRNNEYLTSIIESYTNRKIHYPPEVIYQKLTLNENSVDKNDIQTVLHADRHYRTIKIFYTVSDHTAENGAFCFSPGSHIFNRERVKYEKEYSYRSSLEMIGKKELIDKNFFEFDRSIIHPKMRKKFPTKQLCHKKNTLMIVDVSGFHKRGLISSGNSRETIRMIYHYIHAPVWGQLLFAIFKKSPGRYLN